MNETLYIAAKAPRAGLAKTRLGREIGAEPAVTLYRAFLQDLAARFEGAPFPIGWYATPLDAPKDLAPLVGEARFLDQGSGDWGERQARLFNGAAGRGEEKVVLVASDSPQLTVEVVGEAFRALDRHDLVLGPVHDGGYYLIGMKSGADGQSGRNPRDVLRGVPMSTASVLDDLLARAAAAGLSVALVEATFDVDVVEDLARLCPLALVREDLTATRAALVRLGLIQPDSQAALSPLTVGGTR